MSNLDNLIQKIKLDAQSQVDEMQKEADKKKEEIVNGQVRLALEEKAKIIEKADKEAELVKSRILSNADLRVRDEMLKAKQEVIDKVFLLAKERLMNLNDTEYVEFVKNQISTIELTGEETIIVPSNRKDLIKNLGLNLKVSEEETIDSGFTLVNNKVRLNFSFETLIDFLREDLETEIAQVLFKEE